MKKHYIIVCLLFSVTLSFGLKVDYGLSVDSFVGLSDLNPENVFGFEKVSIYSSMAFNDSTSFAVDGFYKLAYTADSVAHSGDLATLALILPIGPMNIQLGRGAMGDYSGKILSHTLDGITSTTNLSGLTLMLNAGYSGLINIGEVSILGTAADASATSRKRVIEGIDIIKNLETLSFWGSIYAMQDLDALSTNLPVYLGGGLKGSVGSDFYYTVHGVFNTGFFQYLDSAGALTKSLILAGMGSVSINWFMPFSGLKFLSPAIAVDIGISSGDSNLSDSGLGVQHAKDISSGVSQYLPLTSGGPGAIYATTNQNLTYLKFMGSVTPLKALQAQIGSTVFLRTVEGVTGDSSITSESPAGNYLGTEISSTVNYRPFSDLGLSLSGGVFIPDGSIITSGLTGLISLYLSLSI